MGATHTEDDIGQYKGYVLEFLMRYGTLSAEQAAARWIAIEALMQAAGADAVYDVFGVRFIMSDPGGVGLGALFGDRGEGTLEDIIENPRGKEIKLVIGYSLGGGTVAKVFVEHQRDKAFMAVPFFLDEPATFDLAAFYSIGLAKDLPNYAGSFPFWTCGGCGGYLDLPGPLPKIPIGHDVHGGQADYVFDQADRVRAALGGQ
jgi:hypothetical protein